MKNKTKLAKIYINSKTTWITFILIEYDIILVIKKQVFKICIENITLWIAYCNQRENNFIPLYLTLIVYILYIYTFILTFIYAVSDLI